MSDSRRLAQELYEIRALALSHATSPQLGVSSVDGEGLVLRDGDGNDLGRIGGGENGMEVEYLYGPKPPQPSAPDVSADTNLISVRWDGLWADQSETDPDIMGSPVLDRVEVHVSSDENFVPDPIESFAGTMPVLDSGGQILVGPLAEAGDWYVVLLARGKDGQYGAPSDRVHVVTSVGLVENELFDLALRAGEAMESADGKNSVYYGDTEPEPQPRLDEDGEPVLDDDGNPLFNEFTEGDIWFGTGNMPHVWSDTDGWVSAADERVDAIQSAVEDLESALDDVIVGAGMKSFYRGTMPTVEESSEGDLWFDVSDEYRPYRFTDGVWVSVLAGLADGSVTTEKIAQGAITAESGIIGSLDAGKITVGEMDGARIKAGSIQADLVLIEGSVGSTLIREGAITTDKILAGAVTTEKITAGGIDAGVITTGELRGELIRAESIAASALAATAIDGKTITGATVRTAAAGARVEMTPDGLRQYNQFGQPIVEMVGGSATFVGALYSGVEGGSRVQIDPAIYEVPDQIPPEAIPDAGGYGAGIRLGRDQANGIDLYYGMGQRNTSEILRTFFISGPSGAGRSSFGMSEAGNFAFNAYNDGVKDHRASLQISTDQFSSSTTAAFNRRSPRLAWEGVRNGKRLSRMELEADVNGADFGNAVFQVFDHDNNATAGLELGGRTLGRGTFSLYADAPDGRTSLLNTRTGVSLNSGGGGSLTLSHDGNTLLNSRSGGDLRITAAEALRLTSTGDTVLTNGRMSLPNLNSTTGTANLRRTSNGFVGVIGSSRSLKIAEESITVTVPDFADRLLSVDSVTWFDKAAAERIAAAETEKANGIVPLDDLDDVDPLRRIPGVIAEDLHDAGLGILVEYDDEGAPSSVMYDRIGAALIPIVRGLRDRINELEEKIGEWENG